MCASNLGWSVSKLSLLIILVSTSFGNYPQVLLTIFELVLTWYNHLLVEAILAGLGDLVRRPCVCSRRPCARAGPVCFCAAVPTSASTWYMPPCAYPGGLFEGCVWVLAILWSGRASRGPRYLWSALTINNCLFW